MKKKFNMEEEVSKVYDQIAQGFHDTRIKKTNFYNEFLDMPNTLKALGDVKGKKILDIGCGPGLYANILHKMGAEVYGIDISKKEIEIAKKHYKGIDFKVGSAESLPYHDKYFDTALIALAFTHFENMGLALDEVYRVLKDNGHLIISEGNPVIDVTNQIEGKSVLCRKFDNYFKEGIRYKVWNVFMPVRHVTYETFFRLFREHGFILYNYIDSKPLKSGRKVNPKEYSLASKVPYFIVFDLKKLSNKDINRIFDINLPKRHAIKRKINNKLKINR